MICPISFYVKKSGLFHVKYRYKDSRYYSCLTFPNRLMADTLGTNKDYVQAGTIPKEQKHQQEQYWSEMQYKTVKWNPQLIYQLVLQFRKAHPCKMCIFPWVMLEHMTTAAYLPTGNRHVGKDFYSLYISSQGEKKWAISKFKCEDVIHTHLLPIKEPSRNCFTTTESLFPEIQTFTSS